MATIGQLGGLAYEIPLNQRLQQQAPMGGQMAPARVAAPVGVSDDPLASIEGITNEYYGNAAMIQEFTNEMASKGINPFVPDYSQEGGGLAFQTMQKLLANQMYIANKLRNEQVARQQAQPLMMTGQTQLAQGVDQSGFYASDPNNFIPTAVDPRIREANTSLRDNRYTQGDSRALNQAVRDPLAQQYEAAIAAETDPRRRQALEYQLSALQTNTPEVYPGLLRPRSGVNPEDVSGRAELIRRFKQGIVNNDPTSLNMLKMIPGIEDAEYVNTGDRVGIQVFYKGQPNPAFIDLSAGGGENDINALLNRIEGQKNIPNEMLQQFDTRVIIPSSNAGQVLQDVKQKFTSFSSEVMPTLQQLAANRELILPNGEVIASMEIEGPTWGMFGGTDLVVHYHPIDSKGRPDYTKTRKKKIDDPTELGAIVDINANRIARAFGGGFVGGQPEAPQIDPDI